MLEGLSEPTAIRFAADGRAFVALKEGKILDYESLGDPPTVFADLRKQVFDKGDRGILGMALDPEFPAKPYVYVLYTFDHVLGEDPPGFYPHWGKGPSYVGDDCSLPEGAGVDDCPVSGRLVRLTANAAITQSIDEDVLIEDWCQQDSSHSIGDLGFGPEGALFASGGEGASFISSDYGQFGWPHKNQCGDPPGKVGDELKPPSAEGGSLRSQDVRTPENPITHADPTSLDGSVIRVDPETGAAWPGNPMASSSDLNARRIVAYGFRNPFRFAINGESDEVYVDNVGNGTYEEIDRFGIGSAQAYNSGWPCFEGNEPNWGFSGFGLNVCESLYDEAGSTSEPFFFYGHGEGVTPEDPCTYENGSAISGSTFYTGDAFPASYDDALFFADPVRGCTYAMFAGEDGRPDPSTAIPFLSDAGLYPGVDVEEGPDGNLYYASLFGPGFGPGAIHRISYASGNQPPVAHLTATPEWGASPLTAQFDATGSVDADGEALSYEWDPQGDGTYEAKTSNGKKSLKFSDKINHTVAVRVRDGKGATSIDRVTVYPGDTPPQPQIVKPTASLAWHVGQAIEFEGLAHDGEDGDLAETSLDWNSRLYHCPSACHAHPLQAFPSVGSGTLIAPDHDLPSHIELTLTATDSRGLKASKAVELDPKPVGITVESEPSGIPITASQVTGPTPYSLSVIQGSKFTISAPATAKAGETVYAFSAWSDGGERVHTVTASSTAQYKATYSAPDANLTVAEHWSPSGELQADLDGSGSTDPGQSPQYEWDLNDDGSFEAPSAATKTVAIPSAGTTNVALRVSDSRGASDVAHLSFKALSVALESEPPGVSLSAATLVKAAPFNLLAIEGKPLQLSAPAGASQGETGYAFDSWSDAGARTHQITVSAATTEYKATYVIGTPPEEEEPPTEEEGEGEPEEGPAKEPTGTIGPTTVVGLGVDTPDVVPQTTLDKRPAKRTRGTAARFAFSSPTFASVFRCKLDERPYRICTSPWIYRHLQPGWHVFRVAAMGASGKADATPAQFRWWVGERR